MMPHIYSSLWGYPGRWVHFLEDGSNLTMTELLEHMDHAISDDQHYDVCEYNHNEAVVVIHHAYQDPITDQGKNLD